MKREREGGREGGGLRRRRQESASGNGANGGKEMSAGRLQTANAASANAASTRSDRRPSATMRFRRNRAAAIASAGPGGRAGMRAEKTLGSRVGTGMGVDWRSSRGHARLAIAARAQRQKFSSFESMLSDTDVPVLVDCTPALCFEPTRIESVTVVESRPKLASLDMHSRPWNRFGSSHVGGAARCGAPCRGARTSSSSS